MMRVPELRAVDLNLLIPLDALLRERHVSRAAERTQMSQPAMSRALRNLRDAFADELLVRGPGGYRLTPRAERLQRDLATEMPRLARLLSETTFSPQDAASTFALAGTDYVLSLLGEALISAVRAASPGSTLRLTPWHPGTFSDLERGTIDLAFTAGVAPAPLLTERLFDDPYVCVLAPSHPLAARRGPLSLEDYLEAEHVVVGITDGRQGLLDNHLDSLGHARRIGASVPFHALAASVAARSDLIATLPQRTIEALVPNPADAVVRPAPDELGGMTFAMTWHPRLDRDPAHRWLRDEIRAAVASIAAEASGAA